jgi:hypothetical protein
MELEVENNSFLVKCTIFRVILQQVEKEKPIQPVRKFHYKIPSPRIKVGSVLESFERNFIHFKAFKHQWPMSLRLHHLKIAFVN